jgi:hypothetical protein
VTVTSAAGGTAPETWSAGCATAGWSAAMSDDETELSLSLDS